MHDMPQQGRRMTGLDDALRIFDARNAESFARELFENRFKAPFPVPRDGVLPIPTPPERWHQYVAVYAGPGGGTETIGFCNWIRYGDVYLEGGMCVLESAYRRMPVEHFRAVRERGGIAQMMMARAAAELNDAAAWFGYCGDAKAMAVDLRAGYVRTPHPYLIVKWFRDLPDTERQRLIASIAEIGPF
jgi:hypothetical protein